MERKNDITGGLSPEELQREADKIRAEILNDPDVEKLCVTDEMHDRMRERIRKHEEEKARENLSDADKEALRLGRELQNRTKRTRRRKSTRVWVALAATCTLVLGLGVTAVGSKNRLVDVFERSFGSGDKTYVDSDDGKLADGEVSEEQAYEEIKEMFGIEATRLAYKPENTSFLEMQLNPERQEALLYYSVGKTIMNYQIITKYVDGSTGMEIQDKLLQEYKIELPKTEITVREYEIEDTGEHEYTAQFSYKNNKYFLMGIMEKQEFEEILKNLHFF